MSSFDIDLHCNFLKCRKVINQQKACVTSCSHIFCLECANDKFSEAKVCPACGVGLTQRNDIVLIQLSPSEEYKSSILAGLKPEMIIDICNRALSFYNYQVSQELCYRISVQQMMESQLESQQENIQYATRDLHRSLKAERDKVQGLANEFEKEKRRNYDLQVDIQSKAEQFNKLQIMYEKLKRKAMGSMIQQSVQDNRSAFNPPPIHRPGRSNTSFEQSSHYKPYRPTNSPKSYRLAGDHQEAPIKMTPNVVDPTRRETLRHPQKTQVPPASRKHTNRKPPRSVIGLTPNHHHSMHQQERQGHPQRHLFPPQTNSSSSSHISHHPPP